MKNFKIGQTVYYYCEYSGYAGKIITCRIKSATKDLATGEITYVVGSELNEYGWLTNRNLTADYLYSNKKQAIREHKDEIAYNDLNDRLCALDETLKKVMAECTEKIETNTIKWAAIDNSCVTKALVVDGIGNIQEEFNKLKKEVESLKKKIKKPTKKVVKEEN